MKHAYPNLEVAGIVLFQNPPSIAMVHMNTKGFWLSDGQTKYSVLRRLYQMDYPSLQAFEDAIVEAIEQEKIIHMME